jgi:hypothetical protein
MATRMLAGSTLLRDARYNKGTAFSEEERRLLRLEGLLPTHISTQEEQVQRALEQLDRNCATPLDKYIFLQGLSNRNQRLFYRVLQDRVVDLMPVVYTPTVGEAVRTIPSKTESCLFVAW